MSRADYENQSRRQGHVFLRAVPKNGKMKKMIIGITGTIGTGKSAVAKYLSERGYRVLNADAFAKEELEKEEVISEIVRAFGTLVLRNGKIDRRKLGELIFYNREKREILNGIVHPRVIACLKREIEKAEGLLFIEIPLLFEAKLEHFCDKILVVHTSRQTQLERLKKRDGIDAGFAEAKIAAQMDIEEKKKRADYLVDNEGGLDATYEQIENILRRVNDEIQRLF